MVSGVYAQQAASFIEQRPETATDLFVLSLEGNRSVRPLLQTRFAEGGAAISPDGRWIAYQSNRSGSTEVYVAAFPAMEPSSQVSGVGGSNPVWARDGRRLFFRRGQAMMSVDVDTRASIRISKASAVAQLPSDAPPAFVDVMPDGRFLFVDGVDVGRTRELRVVLNWFEELNRLVPVK